MIKEMITFHIFTIFPGVLDSYFGESILGRAQKNKLIKIQVHNIRDHAKDKHKTTDGKPFGGGPGMVMKVQPVIKAIEKSFGRKKKKPLIIMTSASGKQFDGKVAQNLSEKYNEIVIICGRYEGVDERIEKVLKAIGYKTQAVSVGPYILTGGEVPAMIIVDAVSRHIPEVLGSEESLEEIKGSYPVYTRPEIFEYKNKKYRVPKVLLSGNHKEIEIWRRKNSKQTKK